MTITASTANYLAKVKIIITNKICLFFFINLYFISLVFSEEEMDALMDRSDLVDGDTQSDAKAEITQLKGVFKRVDTPIDEMKK